MMPLNSISWPGLITTHCSKRTWKGDSAANSDAGAATANKEGSEAWDGQM